MEWEYLVGFLMAEDATHPDLVVQIVGLPANSRGQRNLSVLGMDRWEMVSAVQQLDYLYVIFKRQKIYAVGLGHKPLHMLEP